MAFMGTRSDTMKKVNLILLMFVILISTAAVLDFVFKEKKEYKSIINSRQSNSEKEIAFYKFIDDYPDSEYADSAKKVIAIYAEEARMKRIQKAKTDSINKARAPFVEAQRKKNLELYGPQTDSNHSDGLALEIAKDFIERRLKSPSTAKHGRYYENEVTIEKMGRNYTVNSYVDSQNGFGAMIRTNYTVKVQYQGNGNWSLIDLELKN